MSNDTIGPLSFFDVISSEGRAAILETLHFNNCENVTPQPLSVGLTDFYVQHYVFPILFILGVAGNSINLLVLLGSGMKNQANILLSAMAFADLAFLICLLPFSLASFELFYSSLAFSFVYHRYKPHAVAFANMFSMCASWLVLAVSIERFSGIRRPMSRLQVREWHLYLLIASVFVLSFVTTFWHHIEFRVLIYARCNLIRPWYNMVIKIPDTSPIIKVYLDYARLCQSIIGVALPVIAVAVLNVSLIYFLRKRDILPRIVGDNRFVEMGAFQRQERKVTNTVIAIVSCFTITHLPTLGPFVWEHINSYGSSGQNLPYAVLSLLNTLLVSGKVLNFVLFCLSSTYFRQRTIVILGARCGKKGRKKYSSMATQSTVNNMKLSNASTVHHSVVLHHTDSIETPCQRSQHVQLQLADSNVSQSLLQHDDSLEMPCSSSNITPTNSAPNSTRSNESTTKRGIFALFQKDRTVS